LAVPLSVGVLVGLAHDPLLGGCDDAADEKRGDVEPLPDREIVAHDDRHLRVEVRDRHRSDRCRRRMAAEL